MNKTIKDILIVLPVIVSVLALLLGENLLERFTSPNLVLTTTNVSPVVPKNKDSKIPNSIKSITIKNKGSKPSKNINIKITFNNAISDLLVKSDEIIKSYDVENGNTASILLDRLSKNASLEVTAWSENQNNNFNAQYTDDIENGSIEVEKEQNFISKYYLIWIFIFLISLGIVIFRYVNNLNKKFVEYKNTIKEEVTGVLIEILDDDDDDDDDEMIEPNESNINETKKRLQKLMQ